MAQAPPPPSGAPPTGASGPPAPGGASGDPTAPSAWPPSEPSALMVDELQPRRNTNAIHIDGIFVCVMPRVWAGPAGATR